MKRFIVALTCLAMPVMANASPELALDWGSKAASLHAATSEIIYNIDHGAQPDIDVDYFSEIERFSATASRLSHWIDAGNGTADLGCIFRGMAVEGERQLDTLDTNRDPLETREALRRLASMFADAEMIAAASTHRRLVPPGAAHAVCPADPSMVLSALY